MHIQKRLKQFRQIFFAKIGGAIYLSTIFARSSTLDVWQGSEYASELTSTSVKKITQNTSHICQ